MYRPVSPAIFGAFCAVVGAVVGAHVCLTAIGKGWWMLWVTAVVASFSLGFALWRRRLTELSSDGRVMGMTVGAVTALAAHFLSIYLMFVGSFVCFLLTGGCTGSLGEAPADPIRAVPGVIVMGLFSLIFDGWVTVPAG